MQTSIVMASALLSVQSLEVISVNIWQILISLANLAILFLIIKKLLYKPVKKMTDERKAGVEKQLADANAAVEAAEKSKAEWQEKLDGAEKDARAIVDGAVVSAKRRSDEIIFDAKTEATRIKQKAEEDAELEKKKARAELKAEIAELSVEVASGVLTRELGDADKRRIIESVIDEISEDENGGNG